MKAIIVLALVAVACAISAPEAGDAVYEDQVNVVDLPDQDADLVNVADPDFAGDDNVQYGDDDSHLIGPTELESVRIELPEGYDPVVGFEYEDPMWR